MRQAGDTFRNEHGYAVLAADGSRFECPRTTANERTLGCAGRAGTTPQVMVTMLYHEGTAFMKARLCRGRASVGSGTDSEQTHLRDLLADLPERTLLVADAGFVSYGLRERLLGDGHAFLLRIGGDRQVLTGLGECGFEAHQQVWLRPQAQRQRPPLSLRLIEVAPLNWPWPKPNGWC